MTYEELYARIVCLERSLKKANYRIYLLEKKKSLVEEAKRFLTAKTATAQLTMFEELEAMGEG